MMTSSSRTLPRPWKKAAWSGRQATCAARLQLCSPGEDGKYGMIGRSRAMQEVYAQVEAAARSDVPVLLLGETGVGQGLRCARHSCAEPQVRGPVRSGQRRRAS